MKKLLYIAALLTISLVAIEKSEARGPSHGSYSVSHSYPRQFRGWSSCYFNSRYGCNFYFCPTRSCYYYFYAPTACYIPVTYLAQYPPTVVATQPVVPGYVPQPVPVAPGIQVTNTNINTAINGPTGPITPGLLPRLP